MFRIKPAPDTTLRGVKPSPPQQVDWAVSLLWVTLFLEIPAYVLTSAQAIDTPFWDLSFVLLIVVMAFLNILVFRGANWARIGRSTLAILGIFAVFSQLPDAPFMLVLVNILGVILDSLALNWLFSKPGTLWFKR